MGKHKSDIDYGIIGARVKELRKAKGLTQERLGELSGIEPSNISHIERGAAKLSLPTLISIANALEATLDEIVYGNLSKSYHVSFGLIDELLSDCSDEEIIAVAEMTRTTKKILRKQ